MNAGGPANPAAAAPSDAAHAADVAMLRSQAEEEAFARQYSMPTRLLGWMLIAGFVLQMVGGFMNSRADLGGIIFLIAGLKVKQGSQAALRFVTFLSVPSVLGLASLIWAAARMRPLEIGHQWYHFIDQEFWTLGVSPLVYLMAEGTLGIAALKTRCLRFWTKTVRVWAWIFGAIFLIGSGFAIRDWQRERALERDMATEIGTARSYLASSSGSVFSYTSVMTTKDTFAPLVQIKEVRWWVSPSGCNTIFNRGLHAPDTTSQQPGSMRKYTGWQRDASGKWGKLEIDLVVPEAPNP